MNENHQTAGSITHLPSGDVYGTNFGCNSDRKIAVVSAGIFVTQPGFTVARVAVRALIWIPRACWEGTQRGRLGWENRRIELLGLGEIEKFPGKVNLVIRVSGWILFMLVKDLFKIIFVPCVSLYIMTLCLAAPVLPLRVQREIARAEEANAVCLGRVPCFALVAQVVNFQAPCFQPDRVCKQNNLYQMRPDYSPETIRSLLLHLSRQVQLAKPCLSDKQFDEEIAFLQKNIKHVTYEMSDCEEIEEMDNLERGSRRNRLLARRESLQTLIRLFKEIRQEQVEGKKSDRTDEIQTAFKALRN